MSFALRIATPADRHALEAVMKDSARSLGAAFYDARQNQGFVTHVAKVDDQLVQDGTYFAIVAGEPGASEQIVACGGWSRRDKRFTGNDGAAGGARLLVPGTDPARVRAMFVSGAWARRGLGKMLLVACERAAQSEGFTSLELMATLPGVPLYRAFGYVDQEPFDVVLPDGVPLPCIRMTKEIGANAPTQERP
jgi:GNAT superfamily N-acetyltransferase